MNDTLHTRKCNGYFSIKIYGKFTIDTVRKIRKSAEEAIQSEDKVILFDMEKTTSIDKNGVLLLVTLQKEAQAYNTKIMIACPSPKIMATLKKIGLDKTIPLYSFIKDFEKSLTSSIKAEDRGFYVILSIPKEFNISIVEQLRTLINESINSGYNHIVADFTSTKMITSVGVGLLINLHKRLQEKGGSAHIINLSDEVRQLLEATNVLKVLPTYKSIDEIDAHFLDKL